MEQSGVRLESTGYQVIETAGFRPLHDYLLIRPLPWKPSRTIQIAGNTRRTLRGTVIKAGPGLYPKRYNRSRTKCWESPAFRPTEVKEGQTVELGGLHIDGYEWPKVLYQGELCIVARDEDICAIVE